jgi:hypothetical protein
MTITGFLNILSNFADRTGLEPATSAVTGRHSNQLNYRSVFPSRVAFIVVPLLIKN